MFKIVVLEQLTKSDLLVPGGHPTTPTPLGYGPVIVRNVRTTMVVCF